MKPEIVELVKELPQQINPKLGKQLEIASKALEGSSKALFLGNFALNILLSGAINQMLSALNKLQIMVHLLLVNVKIPANAAIFCQSLLGLVSFELIDLG
jgi:hypothetical protein